jgi:hypothetical protein
MGQGHRALDVVGDGFARRVRKIIEGQDHDMVAHTDAAVLAPPAVKTSVGLAVLLRHGAHHLPHAISLGGTS